MEEEGKGEKEKEKEEEKKTSVRLVSLEGTIKNSKKKHIPRMIKLRSNEAISSCMTFGTLAE